MEQLTLWLEDHPAKPSPLPEDGAASWMREVEESINGRAKEIIKRVCDEIIVEAGGAEK